MPEEKIPELKPLLFEVRDKAAAYGVEADLIDYKTGMDRADSGYYVVAGFGEIPKFTNPANIERDHLRNRALFHPKAFAMKVTKDNMDLVLSSLGYYCNRVEPVAALYKEYDCPLPDVMRICEVSDLMTCNAGYNNPEYLMTLRMDYKRRLDAFFKMEKKAQVSEGVRDYLSYIRSDLYDGDSSDKYKNRFFNRDYQRLKGKQDIPMELLLNTNTELYSMSFTEERFQEMAEYMKQYPFITYHSGEKEVLELGHVDDPALDPWRGQQRHFEWRDVCFKKVDEPYFANALYQSRFRGVKTNEKIWTWTSSTAEYVPYGNIDDFLKEAEKEGLVFAFDTHGKHLLPRFDSVPVIVAGPDREKLEEIIQKSSELGLSYHAVEKSSLPYLDTELEKAAIRKKRFDPVQKPKKKRDDFDWQIDSWR